MYSGTRKSYSRQQWSVWNLKKRQNTNLYIISRFTYSATTILWNLYLSYSSEKQYSLYETFIISFQKMFHLNEENIIKWPNECRQLIKGPKPHLIQDVYKLTNRRSITADYQLFHWTTYVILLSTYYYYSYLYYYN